MRRKEYWQQCLTNYLEEVEYDPFLWGKHDCSLFIAGCVRAMTGEDVAAAYRGTYDSARSAAKALRDHGAGTLIATVTATFGAPLHIAYVQRGDVVSYQGSLGICLGRYSMFVGSVDETGGIDETAQTIFEQAEAGELADDETEPAIPRGVGRTLIPVLTSECDQAWRVPY